MNSMVSTGTPVAENPFCARRGGQWLSRDDLRAHLAALLRLENVGVLLGSGASLHPLGGMTMATLWDHFVDEYKDSHAWLLANGFVSAAGERPNVEHLGDTLTIAALEWKRSGHAQEPSLSRARAELQRAVIRAALLNEDWWNAPSAVSLDTPELKNHRSILQKLTAARQPGQPAPWIFTTNYDLAVEWAAESIDLKLVNGFDGVHRRTFSPHNFDLGWRNVLARGEARFGTYHVYLAKLHGSLTWHIAEDGTVLEGSSTARWPELRAFLSGTILDLPSMMVLPSTTKYLSTVGFQLGELFRRLAEFLSRPQTCLITTGYSFSDEHINRLLATALQNPTLQLVIYLPEARREEDVLLLEKASLWAKRVMARESPQVTLVGGGSDAYFASLASDLPDPALYDDQALLIRKLFRELAQPVGGGREDAGKGSLE